MLYSVPGIQNRLVVSGIDYAAVGTATTSRRESESREAALWMREPLVKVVVEQQFCASDVRRMTRCPFVACLVVAERFLSLGAALMRSSRPSSARR